MDAEQQNTPPAHPQMDAFMRILVILTLVYTVLVVIVGLISPSDGQTFQFLTTVGGGFAGALLRHITPSAPKPPQ